MKITLLRALRVDVKALTLFLEATPSLLTPVILSFSTTATTLVALSDLDFPLTSCVTGF